MTYCVGLMLDRGLVLMSDTRTNSGVDNISVFRKMHHWSLPGERIVALMTAGNLATTQAVISQLEQRTKAPAERHNTLLEAPTMFQVATIVGKLLRETIQARQADNGEEGSGQFTASMILISETMPTTPMASPARRLATASPKSNSRHVGRSGASRLVAWTIPLPGRAPMPRCQAAASRPRVRTPRCSTARPGRRSATRR